MFCTLLLGKLASVCPDISQKLEFERYARFISQLVLVSIHLTIAYKNTLIVNG